MTEMFKKLGETFVWYKKPRYRLSAERGIRKWVSRLYYFIRGRWQLYRLGKPDVVFFNTITNGLVQPFLSSKAKLSVTYVHELQGSAFQLCSASALQQVKTRTDIFWAGSGAVKLFLEHKLQVEPDRIHIQNSSLANTIGFKEEYAVFRDTFLKKNEWSDRSILIGILAVAESRKGFDLFFPLVSVYFSLFPESKAAFIWKGVKESSLDPWRSQDFEKAGLQNRVRLLPHDADNLAIMSCLDLHLLLSREDPYPLVVMEAASFGICTLCFENAGGAVEFVGEDAGYCLSYGDLVALAQTIRHLELNPARRKALGQRAKEKVAEGHLSSQAAKDLNHLIEKKIQL